MEERIVIREWGRQDRQDVIDLILNIQREEFGITITQADQPDLNSVDTFYQDGDGNFWVALDDDVVVGTIALVDIGNNEVALRKMFVRTDYRGKDKGVGQQLMDVVFEWCRQRGVDSIYLGTINVFKAAQRFYERNGFGQVAKDELPERFPVMEVDDVFYRYRFSL